MGLLQNFTMEMSTEMPTSVAPGNMTGFTGHITTLSDVGTTMSTHNATMTTGYITTTESQEDVYPTYLGFVTAFIAVFFYGTNFAPVKKFDTGDGKFMACFVLIYQWQNYDFIKHVDDMKMTLDK